jgi:hypothetical protein
MNTNQHTSFQAAIEADLERVHHWLDGEGSGKPHSNGVAIAALMQTVERLAAKVTQLDAALADAKGEEPTNPMWDEYKEYRDDLRRKHALDAYPGK